MKSIDEIKADQAEYVEYLEEYNSFRSEPIMVRAKSFKEMFGYEIFVDSETGRTYTVVHDGPQQHT